MPQYPNFPTGHIYDYGRDGSDVAVRDANGVLTAVTTTECDALQRWNPDAGAIINIADSPHYFVVLFPQPRTITGVCWGVYDTSGTGYLEYSSDTTNGHDGSWVIASSQSANLIGDIYPRSDRLFIQNLSNVTSIRCRMSQNSWSMRYFTMWTTDDIGGLTPWHPTNDVALSNDQLDLDRGDVFVNVAPVTQQFRIKNTHGTQTANNVVVSIDTGKGMGALSSEVMFSLDDATYTSSINIASIAPGTISPLIYMQRPFITDGAGTTRTANVLAKATSWS